MVLRWPPTLSRENLGVAGAALFGLILMFGLPRFVELFTLIEITVFVIMAIYALSLAFIWGFGGILCFGQSAFLGLGGYAYAVAAANIDNSFLPVLAAIAVPTLFAAVLGYFMFYGRLSDVYLGVITLTVTLILFNLINSTAGDQYMIGKAALGGFNGMPSIPPLHLQGNPDLIIDSEGMWYLSIGTLVVVYLGLHALLASHFGRVIVSIRENETRAALLGYDPRFYKLVTFALGGAIAGIAGCLFANWGAFISPTIFSVSQSAQAIIWVIVGGLGTLVGPVLGCIALQYLVTAVGTQQLFNANLVMGVILIAFVLLVPKGLLPTLKLLAGRVSERMRAPSAFPVASVPKEAPR